MFDLLILAQESTPADDATGSLLSFLLPILLLVGVFYFLIIRPQRTRARRHQELMSELEIGDRITTVGGIYGTIRSMDDESVVIEVEDGGSLRISRRAVGSRVTADTRE